MAASATPLSSLHWQDRSRAQKQDPVLEQPPCTIALVSGLPRSGTSMMMQMLEAGGLPR